VIDPRARPCVTEVGIRVGADSPVRARSKGGRLPVVRNFTSKISIAELFPIFDSLGAHVAAKLEQFGTDERTLTDDWCDMFYIWSQHPNARLNLRGGRTFPHQSFPVLVSKTTQQEEATVGADLAITITTPEGTKRALIQAKVLDPKDQRLRCDTAEGWDKLWSQLVLMQKRNGDLSFLLVYVPASYLDGAEHGYATWEQGLVSGKPTSTSSEFGATLIPVGELLDSSGNWRHQPPLGHTSDGRFSPRGISVSDLLIDMLTCSRGVWRPYAADDAVFQANLRDHFPVHYRAYREIGMSFAEASAETWGEAIASMRRRNGNK